MLRSRALIVSGTLLSLMFHAGCLFGAGTHGYWSGITATPAGSLSVALTIPNPADRATALLDAPLLGLGDQAMGLRVEGSRLELRLDLEGRAVIAEATVSGDSLRGVVHLDGQVFPLALRRSRKPERTYRTEEVVLRNGDVALAGTLYLPRGTRPVPGLVFVAGLAPRSGATHFLADLFASRGLAVLTYERRGFGGSTGNPRAGFAAHASDAAAALRYLESRPEVDPHRVGIRGQSQGAWLAPLAAQQVPVAFVIATGGGGIPPWQSELYAVPTRMQADRLPPELIADARRYMERMFKVAATGQGWDGFHDMVEELRGRNVTWLDRYAPQYDTQEDLQAAWKRDFSYDPAPALRALRSPLLALMGDHDVYAPPAENLRALDSLLTVKDRTLRTIPSATHDFHVPGAPVPLVSREYLQALTEWTLAHAGVGSSARRVDDHRILSTQPPLTITVDSTLRYVGALEFDIRDAAHAERIVFADADSSGTIRRLWIAQFEAFLPQHPGSYDVPAGGDRARLGPYEFRQVAGAYSFAAAIAAKPGHEAERTRDFLLAKGLHVGDSLMVARFEARTDRERRHELILFYWEDLRTAGASSAAAAVGDESFRRAFAERAKTYFAIRGE